MVPLHDEMVTQPPSQDMIMTNHPMVPYQPPTDQHVHQGALVGPGPFVLPKVCVRCGAHVSSHTHLQLTKIETRSPLVWLGFLVGGILGYLAVYWASRKRTELTYSMCDQCIDARDKRSKALTASMLGTASVGVAALATQTPLLLVVSMVVLMVLGVWFNVARRAPVRARWNAQEQFVLTGLPLDVLDQLSGFTPNPRMFPAPAHPNHHTPPWQSPAMRPGPSPKAPPPADGTDGTV